MLPEFIVIVRHGDRGFGGGDDPVLSELGVKQIRSLREVINGHFSKTAKSFGNQSVERLLFSFSDSKRALQSIQGVSSRGEDIIVTNLFITERRDINAPMKIVEKVVGLARYYNAKAVVIVAHGDMPAVITETAHELATGKKHEKLPYTREACGYITNMSTGEVIPICPNVLDEKKPPKSVVPKPLPQAVTVRVPKYDPSYDDDDIPF